MGYEADERLYDGLLPIAIKCYGVWYPNGSYLKSIVTNCYWVLWFVMADRHLYGHLDRFSLVIFVFKIEGSVSSTKKRVWVGKENVFFVNIHH